MQIKYNNQVKNGIVYVELETCNFTCKEQKALAYLGEPKVFFNKHYGLTDVLIDNRRIKSGFKVRFRFDGNGDPVQAVKDASTFYEDIKAKLFSEMNELLAKFELVDTEIAFGDGIGFEVGTGIDTEVY